MTMTLIETKTLGADAASIEFTSIPQDGTDLVVYVSGRFSNTNQDSLRITFNSNLSNYNARWLTGNGSTAGSGSQAEGVGSFSDLPGSNRTANTFGNTQIYIPNYAGSTNKSWSSDSVGENNATEAHQAIVAGLWSNTSAITTLKLEPFSGANFVSGVLISLYKVTKGSDGIVTTS